MNTLILVENFSPHFNYLKSPVVALTVHSHFELLNRKIDHLNISDIVNFNAYLKHTASYNDFQKKFFKHCDENFYNIKINEELRFAPFHILGYEFKIIFDSLFSQSIVLSTILKKFSPQKVILLTSYKPLYKRHEYKITHNFNKHNYEFLNYEILNHFSSFYKFEFEIKVIPKSYSEKIDAAKNWIKGKIKKTKFFNIYYHPPKYKSINTTELKTFDFLKETNNLFCNQGWGLDRLVKYSLVSNTQSFVLRNNYLFIYKGTRLFKCIPLRLNKFKSDFEHCIETQSNTEFFDRYIRKNMGFSLSNLISERLKYINNTYIPILLNGCSIIDKLLKKFRIKYVFGNQKMDILHHIIAFIASYDSDYKYIYFTHGYDIYDVERTFLELPCNIYYTVNKEYRNYFHEQFHSQDFYIKPTQILVNPSLHE